mmetsp:Transcript_27875/g.53035  ORF Transcript_27875/g.53035 Transcript_27875/m.53035 type:complete len:247 (+) Transcript_27875:1000-1740(+)
MYFVFNAWQSVERRLLLRLRAALRVFCLLLFLHRRLRFFDGNLATRFSGAVVPDIAFPPAQRVTPPVVSACDARHNLLSGLRVNVLKPQVQQTPSILRQPVEKLFAVLLRGLWDVVLRIFSLRRLRLVKLPFHFKPGILGCTSFRVQGFACSSFLIARDRPQPLKSPCHCFVCEKNVRNPLAQTIRTVRVYSHAQLSSRNKTVVHGENRPVCSRNPKLQSITERKRVGGCRVVCCKQEQACFQMEF